ncbi:MAG TPA: SWIB/MDM2 domain-containing protein [Segetibacter sp.]|jgi:chromatin remodeling complex protein RSC6
MAKAAKKAAPQNEAPKKAAAKAPKKAAAKSNGKGSGGGNQGLAAPLTLSPELAKIVGKEPIPRTEIIKKMWDYIKANNLQDQANKRMINADDKLKVVFDGKDQVSMFELAKVINNHVKK